MHDIPSVNVRSAKEAAKGAAIRRVVRGTANCGLSSFLESEKCKQEEGVGKSTSARERSNSPLGEVRDNESKRSGCRGPDVAVSFA